MSEHGSYREGYLFEGRPFLCRRDFYSPDAPATFHPEIFSSLRFSSRPAAPLFDSIRDFLVRIHDAHGKIYILYSGGIDSEILLYVALKTGLNCVPVIVDLCGLNYYELGFARQFFEEQKISRPIWVKVTESEMMERWIPELIYDSESLSYILGGAYIAARNVPNDGAVIQAGENPNVFVVRDGELYWNRHEWSLWAAKVARRYAQPMYELYADPEVVKSYLSYRAHLDRFFSNIPFGNWWADHEWLGKEYLYNDPDFAHLRRRYAQHGWEPKVGRYKYQKGMVPLEHFSATDDPFLAPAKYVPMLLQGLDRSGDGRPAPPMKASAFNRSFYVHLGKMGVGEVEWNSTRDLRTRTDLAGNFSLEPDIW